MRIESVDVFCLAMPSVRAVGDGSQDALLVRVRAGGHTGWGGYGRGAVSDDAEQVRAARDGLGPAARLFVDAGTVWGDDVRAAAARLPALAEAGVGWLEEPFVSGALDAYAELAPRSPAVPLAAGEGAHDPYLARYLVDVRIEVNGTTLYETPELP